MAAALVAVVVWVVEVASAAVEVEEVAVAPAADVGLRVAEAAAQVEVADHPVKDQPARAEVVLAETVALPARGAAVRMVNAEFLQSSGRPQLSVASVVGTRTTTTVTITTTQITLLNPSHRPASTVQAVNA